MVLIIAEAPPALVGACSMRQQSAVIGSHEPRVGIGDVNFDDAEEQINLLISEGHFDDELAWVTAIWAIRRSFGDAGWPLVEKISYDDTKNRLAGVWSREDPKKDGPSARMFEGPARRAGWQKSVQSMFGGVGAAVGVGMATVATVAAPLWKSAADLMAKTFTPVSYVVPKYVAEGCTLFAGRPKIGKSWMTEDMALAVAAGGEVLGEKVEQGDVLLLALEDNERRLQERFGKILGPFGRIPEALTYSTEWKRVDEGGLETIEAWVRSVKKPRLVVVDVLERVRPQQQGRKAQYEADYQAIAGLQRIASQHRIAILIVHHVRKSASESGDAIDKISGTLGLSGAADSILILDRDGQGTKLYGRGRDVEEIDMAVTFDKGRCRWNVIGQAGEVRKSDERRLILDALNSSTGAMKRADIVAATGMKSNSVGFLLSKMMRDGEIERASGGGYLTVIRSATPANSLTPLTANIPSKQIIAPPMPYQRITAPPPMPPTC